MIGKLFKKLLFLIGREWSDKLRTEVCFNGEIFGRYIDKLL